MELINKKYRIIKPLNLPEGFPGFHVKDITAGGQERSLLTIGGESAEKVLQALYTSDFKLYKSLASSRLVKSFDIEPLAAEQSSNVGAAGYCCISEYTDMDNLKDIVMNITVEQSLNIFSEICKAVHYLHTKQIIYGCLNASNIFAKIGEDSCIVKLRDLLTVSLLSLLRQKPESSDITAEEIFYSAPEVIYENNLTKRADIYSMGVLLFYLIFKKDGENTGFREVLKSVKKIATDVFSQEIIRIIEKATAVLPERYGNVISLLDDFNVISGNDFQAYDCKENEILSFGTKRFGREDEYVSLIEIYDKINSGVTNQRYICVNGASGIGKTFLLNTVRDHFFINGVPVYWAMDTDSDGAIKAILRQLLVHVGETGTDPTLLDYIKSVAVGGSERKLDYDRTNIIKFIFDCIKNKPVVFILDDFDKADEFTVNSIERLMNVCGKLMLLFSCTDRSKTEWLSEFCKKADENSLLMEIVLDGLSEEETMLLIRQALSHSKELDGFSGHIYKNASGNPFFTQEIIKTLNANRHLIVDGSTGLWTACFDPSQYSSIPIPTSIETAVKEQGSRFNDNTLEILKMISLYDKLHVTSKMITHLLPSGINNIATELESLTNTGVLRANRESEARYSFINPLLKKQVYEAMGGRAAELHAAVANALIANIENPSAVALDEIIYQLDASGHTKHMRLLPIYCDKAAEICFNLKDIDKAAVYFEKAIYHCENTGDTALQYDLLMKLGKGLYETKRFADAADIFLKAIDLSTEDDRREALACIELACCYGYMAQIEKAQEYANRAEAKVANDGWNAEKRVRLSFAHMLYRRLASDDESFYDFMNRSLEECPEDFHFYKGHFYGSLGLYASYNKTEKGGMYYNTKAVEEAEKSGVSDLYEKTLSNLAIEYMRSGDYEMFKVLTWELLEKVQTPSNMTLSLQNMAHYYSTLQYEIYEAIKSVEEAINLQKLTAIAINNDQQLINYINLAGYSSIVGLLNDMERSILDAAESSGAEKRDDLDYVFSVAKSGCYLTAGELDLSISEADNVFTYSFDIPYYERLKRYVAITKMQCQIMKQYTENGPSDEISEMVKAAVVDVKDLIEMDRDDSDATSICNLISFCTQMGLYGYLDHISGILNILIEKAKKLPYISQIMKANINYAESFCLQGEERVQALMHAVYNANEMKLYMILTNASFLLSKYYNEINEYLSLYYCAKACEAVRSQLTNTPAKGRSALIKSYNLYEPFNKIVKEMGIEYSGLDPEEVIMNPEFYDKLQVDKALVRLGRETYLSDLPVRINSIDDIFKYSGGIVEDILSLTVKYIAALALGSCFVAAETDEGAIKVIASSGGNTEIYGSALFNRAKSNVMLMADKNINPELLPDGIKAITCIPLRSGVKSIGYIVISSDSLLHNINEELISECEQLFPLCAINVTLLNVQAGVVLDKLSGVLNRKYLELALDYHIEKAAATNSVFSMIILDIDKFKGINDTYGHSTGDMVIRSLGGFLRDNLRKDTPIGRYGGEEFVVVLENTSSENAYKMAEELRITLDEAKLLGFKRHVTGSFGIATYGEHGTTKKDLMHKADLALFMCKERGRNRCEVYDSSFESSAKITNTTRNIISSDLVKSTMRMRITLEIIEMSKVLTDKRLYLEKINDMAETDTCEYSTTAGDLQFIEDEGADKLSIIIPVKKGGKIIGTLHLTDKLSRRRYDIDDSEFMHQLSDLFVLSGVSGCSPGSLM